MRPRHVAAGSRESERGISDSGVWGMKGMLVVSAGYAGWTGWLMRMLEQEQRWIDLAKEMHC